MSKKSADSGAISQTGKDLADVDMVLMSKSGGVFLTSNFGDLSPFNDAKSQMNNAGHTLTATVEQMRDLVKHWTKSLVQAGANYEHTENANTGKG